MTRRMSWMVWCGLCASLPATLSAQVNDESLISDAVKIRDVITSDAEMAPRIDNEPLDPAQRGFFAIPGTKTRLRLGGYARLDVLHDLNPIGSTDDFVVATIPVAVTNDVDNTTIHARQSRLNLELRRPGALGEMRMLFETDFFGTGGERAFNLRNAYGQAGNVLAGFTASTVADPDARPDTLDHEGPPARVSTRHAQLRWTLRLPARQGLAFAVEEPRSDIAAAFDGEVVTPRSAWPDVVTRYRIDARRGHVQVGAVYRSIGGFVGSGDDHAQVFGVGVVTSGSAVIAGRDTLVWEAVAGRGVARYVKDAAGLGLDAAVNASGRLEALAIAGGLAGYQHHWAGRWRSTVAGSVVNVDVLPTQPDDTYRRSLYVAANLLFRSSGNLTIGVEMGRGRLTVSDGRRNSATRVQVAVQYNLIE